MSDLAGEICVRFTDDEPREARKEIWFYGHYAAANVQRALYWALHQGRARWTDPAYLTGVLARVWIRLEGDGLDGTLGIGIDVDHFDNANCVTINVHTQRIAHGPKVLEDGSIGVNWLTYAEWMEVWRDRVLLYSCAAAPVAAQPPARPGPTEGAAGGGVGVPTL